MINFAFMHSSKNKNTTELIQLQVHRNILDIMSLRKIDWRNTVNRILQKATFASLHISGIEKGNYKSLNDDAIKYKPLYSTYLY